MKRDYGRDSYWQGRYEKRLATSSNVDEDETDEWLFSWQHLKPLLCLPQSGARICDLGCGTSALCLDAVSDLGNGAHAVGVDIAPAAIEFQRNEQKIRIAQERKKGTSYSSHAEFICKDLCRHGAWGQADCLASFDACIDKATTDGLLCDTKRGAARVRNMYAEIAPALKPEALIAVLSWRSPLVDGVDWFVDCVLGGLREGGVASRDVANGGGLDDAARDYGWTLDVHSITRDEDHESQPEDEDNVEAVQHLQGPHVYLLRRRPRRRSRRKNVVEQRLSAAGEQDEENIQMRHHLHPL